MRPCACWPPRSRARRCSSACTMSFPTRSTVETTSWLEQKNGVRIEQTIFVERDSQKAIVLGNGGRMIRQLSMEAAQGAVADRREAGAPLPVREGARELGQRPRALSRAWFDVSEELMATPVVASRGLPKPRPEAASRQGGPRLPGRYCPNITLSRNRTRTR